MGSNRTLRLRKEALTELAAGELESVVGGTTSMFTCQLPRCQSPLSLGTICCPV